MAKAEFDSKLYEDHGCSLAPKCLSCPFPECFQGEPRKLLHWRMDQDAEHLDAMILANNWSAKKAGKTLGFNRSYIYQLTRRVRRNSK